MRVRHEAMSGVHARALLASINASIGQNFFTLTSAQVSALLDEADRVRYQKPKNANGSRGRYFYARVQREAKL